MDSNNTMTAEQKRELGKVYFYNRDADAEKKNLGLKLILEAHSMRDPEAMYIVALLILRGVLRAAVDNQDEHVLSLMMESANAGYIQARAFLNAFCEKRYREHIGEIPALGKKGELTDFDGNIIKIDRKGILTPIDAKLEFVNGENVLTFTTNVSFVEYESELPELFYDAVIDGIKEWEGVYTVFGGQRLTVKVDITFDERLFDSVYIFPMTDDVNLRISQFWDKYGTKRIKKNVDSIIGDKRSAAGVGIRKWSVNSRKFIFIQSDDGKFDNYDELKHVSKHEFGHALGLGDMYRCESDGLDGVCKGSYFETDSYYVTNKIYNLVMCDHHGPISNNDIEMIVLAFSKNKMQLYQPGRLKGEISFALGKGN